MLESFRQRVKPNIEFSAKQASQDISPQNQKESHIAFTAGKVLIFAMSAYYALHAFAGSNEGIDTGYAVDSAFLALVGGGIYAMEKLIISKRNNNNN